jgi:hypothetical protein
MDNTQYISTIVVTPKNGLVHNLTGIFRRNRRPALITELHRYRSETSKQAA